MSERSPIQSEDSPPGGPATWAYAACGALGLAAGVGSYAAGIRSPIAALVAAWYTAESLLLLSRLLGPAGREEQHAALLRFALPRALGSAIALPLSYLLACAWTGRIPLGYLILIALEGTYRAMGRVAGWSAGAPPTRQASVTPEQVARRFLGGRIAVAALTVLLLIGTLYAQALRSVALDARVYAAAFEPAGLYERLLDAAARLLVDAARDQGRQARRAVDLLSEQELSAATRLVLPEAWTVAVVEQALALTFSWIEEDAASSVPPVTVPVADLQRHLKLAVSFLFDQVAPRLPACAEGMSSEAFCRPADSSVVAFAATQKPEVLAMVEQAFGMLPAEVDVATAVTMSPRTFRQPLAVLAQVRDGIVAADRLLLGLGWAALVAYLILLALSARSPRDALLWSGIVLLGTGAGGWLLSWGLAALGTRPLLARAIVHALPDSAREVPYLLPLLTTALRAVHARLWPVELAAGAAGGLAIVAGMALPSSRQRWRIVPALRLTVAVAAALSLLWAGYLRVGERAYERAYACYREGEIRSALSRYRVLLSAYPLGVRRPFVARAERDARVCVRAVEAGDALHAGAYDRAAAVYEALLVANPPVAVRDAAAQGLLAALQEGAAALQAGGAYERALDRLRLANEALGSRTVYEPMAALYLEWGDALLAGGDYEAATATYLRLRSDVASARQWQAAEERAADAYCAWQAALRDARDEARAARVCDLFAEALPRAVGRCGGCGR